MNIALVVAGVVAILWPLQARRSIRRIHDRLAAAGEDTAGFDRAMGRWLRVISVVGPVVGVVVVVIAIGG